MNKSRTKRARENGDSSAAYEPSDVQEETLYTAVLSGKAPMTELAAGWIERYQDDRDTALLEIIQFFISSSGCKSTVTPQLYRGIGSGFQEVLKTMTDEFGEEGSEYPLTLTGTNFRRFKPSLGDFITQLVKQCAQAELLYDEFMMDYVLQLLSEMSASHVRPFRHTGTFCAMKLMSALVGVALNVNKEIEDTTKQYEGECNKHGTERSTDALDMLNDRKAELETHQQEVEQFLNTIFKDIFIMRYRDICSDIRVICMDEISVWMRTFPKVFLSDQYLKYVGWLLNDKAKEVRKSCLNALGTLFRDKELCNDLALFTKRFKKRLVSMACDVDNECSVFAIRALTNILMNRIELNLELTDEDCESIYSLVFHVHRPIAVAAAEFLNKKLFSTPQANDAMGFTRRGKRKSQNAPHLVNLVEFYTDADIHHHTTYLVDALWEVNPHLLRDWECMTQLLLDDDSVLKHEDETALVDLLVRTVKQAAIGTPPAGRTGVSSKKATGARDRQRIIEDRQQLTDELIEPLPRLYAKFGSDRDKMILLLQIPRYFDLDSYTVNRGEKHLDDLLHELTQVVEKHAVEEILNEAAETFAYLANPDANICTKVHSAVTLLVDHLNDNFIQSVSFLITQGDQFTAQDTASVGNLARRLAILSSQNDLTHKEISHSAIDLLKARTVTNGDKIEIQLNDALVAALLKMIFTDVIWWKMKLVEAQINEVEGAVETVKQLVKELFYFCEIALSSDSREVQDMAYSCSCDALVAYAPQIAHIAGFERLVTPAPIALITTMKVYMKEHIFTPAIGGTTPTASTPTEEQVPKLNDLHKRRKYLAAFCKLFAFRMIELRHGAEVFMHYLKCYADYGDIIKEAISKSRNLDQVTSAHTLVLALRKQYQYLLVHHGGALDKSSQDFAQLKELARRFALTFGLDTVRTRDAVSNLHRGGIDFAMEMHEKEDKPRFLSFLEVLTEFSTKLIKQDRAGLLRYLEARLPEGRKPHTKDEYWIPYMTYRNTLQTTNTAKGIQPMQNRNRNVGQVNKPSPQQQQQQQRQRHSSTSSSNSQDSVISQSSDISSVSQVSSSILSSTQSTQGFAESTRIQNQSRFENETISTPQHSFGDAQYYQSNGYQQ